MNKFYPFHECPFREYRRGFPIVNSPDYPKSSLPYYLPGDEPGYFCIESDLKCDKTEKINCEDCPRLYKEFTSEGEIFIDSVNQQHYIPWMESWISLEEYETMMSDYLE